MKQNMKTTQITKKNFRLYNFVKYINFFHFRIEVNYHPAPITEITNQRIDQFQFE